MASSVESVLEQLSGLIPPDEMLALEQNASSHRNLDISALVRALVEREKNRSYLPRKLLSVSVKPILTTITFQPCLEVLVMFANLFKRRRSRKSGRSTGYRPFLEPLEDRTLLTTIVFDTELVSLDLTGGPYPIPLASDPGNVLPDSVAGYGFVESEVKITLSSQRDPDPSLRSLGQACATNDSDPVGQRGCLHDIPHPTSDPINPAELDGQTFAVDSFFDVFFDITVTDVDDRPGRDFAGQADGASFLLPNNGPANMLSLYTAVFDADAPNFGIVPPPEVAPYIGHFQIEIPLGGDINGNGENDKIKFTIASHAAGDENRTFTQLPDGTVLDEFDSAAFLAGAVVDESTDPPFTLGAGSPAAPAFSGPGALTGPTTATSTLLIADQAAVDIKPGNAQNKVNAKSQGVLHVALYTTDDFDAALVDTSTIRLAGVQAQKVTLKDVDGDGDLDLVLRFSVQDLRAAAAPDLDSGDKESVEVALTGETADGVLFEGSDTINFFFPGKGKGRK
jgi:hypothetical protein